MGPCYYSVINVTQPHSKPTTTSGLNLQRAEIIGLCHQAQLKNRIIRQKIREICKLHNGRIIIFRIILRGKILTGLFYYEDCA